MRCSLRLLAAVVVTAPVLAAAVVIRPLAPPPPEGLPVADGFDFPVGAPDAQGYRDAQPFGRNDHLGSDWNAVTGGDSDLGDPVFAAASGLVLFAAEGGPGWGPVVRVLHQLPDRQVETLYAHLDTVLVQPGQRVERGQQLGTIGTAHGRYLAHLHFELRDIVGMDLGPGYAAERTGWVDPTAFILAHRPAQKRGAGVPPATAAR